MFSNNLLFRTLSLNVNFVKKYLFSMVNGEKLAPNLLKYIKILKLKISMELINLSHL